MKNIYFANGQFLLLLGIMVTLLVPAARAANTFAATGSLTTGRGYHSATLLPSGKLLVVGGYEYNSGIVLSSAELYDPTAGTWAAAGSLTTARHSHSATLLPNGKLLVVGGNSTGGGGSLASAELYDPATGTWAATGALATARGYHTATLLSNGKVLVAGGSNNGTTLASAELYDPTTGTWSATGSLATARQAHSAALLPNGKVLVAGGANATTHFASAELYDPATGIWTATGNLATTRANHTATLLPNGKLLVVGGSNGTVLTSTELYDPATGTWSTTGSLVAARYTHSATLLPNGKLLVAGGYNDSIYLSSAELYDPATGTWTTTGSLAATRYKPTATLLPNGKLLVAGGSNGSGSLASAELYDVGLGFTAGWQPQISSASFDASGKLILSGSSLRGISSASGGNGTQDSPSNYPVVQLRRLDNDQSIFLLSDPSSSVSSTAFTSVPVTSWTPGYALATAFTNGIPSEAVIVALPASDIAVEQPVGTGLVDGSAVIAFGTVIVSSSTTKTFTINNSGNSNLTLGAITLDGIDSSDCTVDTSGILTTLVPGGSTTFTVTFNPLVSGARSAALHIASNVNGAKNPFDIDLTGRALSTTEDSDGDGVSDATEFALASLGFDWQVAQSSALLGELMTNANLADLYTSAQIQALHVNTPLLTKDLATGKFKLTLGIEKSTDLTNFTAFPLTAPDTTINEQGKLEFQFVSPDNAAFFLLKAQ